MPERNVVESSNQQKELKEFRIFLPDSNASRDARYEPVFSVHARYRIASAICRLSIVQTISNK